MKILAILLSLLLALAALPALAEGAPMDDAQWGQMLIGSWCEDASVGAGYGERWIFTEDALYVLPSQYVGGDAQTKHWAWSVREGQLWCGPEGFEMPFELSGPRQVDDEESPYSPCIEIDGKPFYQYSSDPAYFDDLDVYGIAVQHAGSSPKAVEGGGNWWDGIGPTIGSELEPGPEPEPEPEPDPATPDGDVPNLTANAYGGACQYAQVGNWTVAYGNCDDHFCVFGWNSTNAEYHILAETNVGEIVPAGDVFAVYGEVSKGKYGWLAVNPDQEKPVNLGLNQMSSVFWADAEYFYYFTYVKGTGTTYSRMDHQGKNKRQLGKLNGRAVAMTKDGGVVVQDAAKNRVQIFRDGAHTTVYEPADEIVGVISGGDGIWVSHADRFGLVKDGALGFQLLGRLRCHALTGGQMLVVMDDGAVMLNVTVVDEASRRHAVAGQIVAQEDMALEVTPGWLNRFVAWGMRESISFFVPPTDQWQPYE